MNSDRDLLEVIADIGDGLKQNRMQLAVAESCTGGWLCQMLTAVSGSSEWFDRGFVTYSNAAKSECLGVSQESLRQYGAVSEQIVIEMAKGVANVASVQFGLAISGIAGPQGASQDKPIGTVCIAWSFIEGEVIAKTFSFDGGREDVRRQSVEHAIYGLAKFIHRSLAE